MKRSGIFHRQGQSFGTAALKGGKKVAFCEVIFQLLKVNEFLSYGQHKFTHRNSTLPTVNLFYFPKFSVSMKKLHVLDTF